MDTLVITLPDAVTDNTIRRLNEVRFEIGPMASEESKKAFGLATTAPGLIRCPDGNMYFNNPGGTPGTVPLHENALSGSGNLTYWWFATPGSHVLVSPKANITQLTSSNSLLKGDFSQLKYSPSLVELDLGQENLAALTGSIEEISQASLDSIPLFKVRGPGVTGNISCLSENTSLEEFVINGSDCTGDITSLAKCVNLERVRYHNSQVVGDMDDLADALFANGKISGTILYTYNSGGSGKTYTFTSEGWTVS